jgi:hypothetical protein
MLKFWQQNRNLISANKSIHFMIEIDPFGTIDGKFRQIPHWAPKWWCRWGSDGEMLGANGRATALNERETATFRARLRLPSVNRVRWPWRSVPTSCMFARCRFWHRACAAWGIDAAHVRTVRCGIKHAQLGPVQPESVQQATSCRSAAHRAPTARPGVQTYASDSDRTAVGCSA